MYSYLGTNFAVLWISHHANLMLTQAHKVALSLEKGKSLPAQSSKKVMM